MTKQERKYVQETVYNEGFHYAFIHYADYENEVKDPTFHMLRIRYEEAAKALADYIEVDV